MKKTNLPLRFVVVGLGSIGRRHLRNLSQLGFDQLAAVSRNICKLPKDDLPAFQSYESLEAALTFQPDAVLICHPTALHMEAALEAARAGCHLFLEKPISHSLKGVQQLEQLVEANELVVQTGFQFRFHPLLIHIKHLMEQQSLGRLLSLHAHWGEYLPGWHPWEDHRHSYAAREALGGGVIRTLCHPFDYLRWLAGEVEGVFASGGKLSSLQIDAEDTALVQLQFRSGAVGSVYLDYLQQRPRHELCLVLEGATLSWNGLQNRLDIAKGKKAPSAIHLPKDFERNQLFLDELNAFTDSLLHGMPIRCSLQDGIAALRIALAARQSLTTRKLVHPSSLQVQTAEEASIQTFPH
ncbi:MAG: Gfo/Idh/MocA family oxidoreductase [Bacteroidota bacterium]